MAADEDAPLEQLSTQEVRLWSLDDIGVASEFAGAVPQLDRPARTGLVVDLDRDGDCDLLLGSLGTHRLEVLERTGPTGHSVRVRLSAKSTATSAFGAQVLLVTDAHRRVQVLAPVAGFQTAGPRELVFGLGDETAGVLSVLWPGKAEFEPFGRVKAGGAVVLVEGQSSAQQLRDEPQPLAVALPEGVKLRIGDRPAAWPLITTAGVAYVLPFTDAGEALTLHLVNGDSDLIFLAQMRDTETSGTTTRYALALNASGWTERGRHALDALNQTERITGLMLDWDNPANLRAIDPSLDLYTLELPTTLTFDRNGYVVAIERNLTASESSGAKPAAR